MTLEDPAKAGSRFPFINLQKALERAKLIFDADQKGREIAIAGAFEVWGYSEKSSGGFQTIAALKMYGILKDSGGGDSRKIALTHEALQYFRDERPEEHRRLRQYFAQRPRLIQALWGQWHDAPPADTVARSYLKTEVSLNDQSARSLLAIYKENIAFADFKGDSKPPVAEATEVAEINPAPTVKIGDHIQWTSGGMDQFAKPARVAWLSEDGSHLRVHGSTTGIPVQEVAVVEAPTAMRTSEAPKTGAPKTGRASSAYAGRDGDLSVLLKGNRLEISADVDLHGIERLKEILGHYENILKLLAPPTTPKRYDSDVEELLGAGSESGNG